MDTITHPNAPAQRLTARQVGSAFVLAVAETGEIDTHTARAVQHAILEAQRQAPGRTVVLDLRAVGLIDGAGWAMLIATHQQMHREGRRLRVLLARGLAALPRLATRWLHVVLDRLDGLDDLAASA